MAPVAVKAGVLLAVAAAGSTSVWYFSDSIFGSPLASIADETPAPDYGEKSIGKNYSKYFLSSKKNQKVWQKRFDGNETKFAGTGAENTNTKAKDKFGTVKTAFSTDNNNTTALNKVCEEAYKLTDSTKLVTEEPSSDGTDKFTSSNIWKFCGLGPIFTLENDAGNYDSTTLNSKIGGETNNRKILVSTKKEENDWFWKIREEEFKKTEGERSKAKVTGTDTTNNLFAKLKTEADPKNLSSVCEETYKKEDTSDTNKNKTDAELFCSIKLTIPASTQ